VYLFSRARTNVGGRLLTHKLQCEGEEEADFADDYVQRVPDIEDMNRILGTQEPENVFFDRGLVPYLDAHRAGMWKTRVSKLSRTTYPIPTGTTSPTTTGSKLEKTAMD